MKINQNQPTNKITYRGVFPSESCMLTDALCRRRICIIFRLPLAAALCNGVDSKWSVASGSAPFSRSMIAIWRHRKRKRGKKNEEKFIITKHFFWEQHQLQQHRQPYLLLIFGGCVVQGRAAVLIDSIDGSPLVNEGLHDLIAARRRSNVQGSPTSLQRQAQKLLKQRCDVTEENITPVQNRLLTTHTAHSITAVELNITISRQTSRWPTWSSAFSPGQKL